MTAFWKTDAAVFFGDLGVTVTWGGVSVQGLFDDADTPQLDSSEVGRQYGSMVLIHERTVLLQAATIPPALLPNTTGTVDGVAYLARELRAVEDGQLVRVLLVPVTT